MAINILKYLNSILILLSNPYCIFYKLLMLFNFLLVSHTLFIIMIQDMKNQSDVLHRVKLNLLISIS